MKHPIKLSPPKLFKRRIPAVGDVFGFLTVTATPEKLMVSKEEWTCSCACGQTGVRLRGAVLLQGQISCGCRIGKGGTEAPSIGQVFNRLIVIGVPDKQRLSKDKWTCRCQCGNSAELEVVGEYLVHGQVKSCGCLDKENKAARTEYYRARRLAARSWKTMIKSLAFDGPPIDPRWHDFECFFADMGERPVDTLLSRRDFAEPFSASNCFWEDRRSQFERVRKASVAKTDLENQDGTTKRCTKCLVEKPLTAFSHSRRGTEPVVQSHCKQCLASYSQRRDPAKKLLQGAKNRALEAGLEFNLTLEDILPLPTHCPVLGIELKYGSRNDRNASYTIDRVNNDLGYIKGNCVVISWLANRLKSNGTSAQHARIAQWMREHEDPTIRSSTAGISMGFL